MYRIRLQLRLLNRGRPSSLPIFLRRPARKLRTRGKHVAASTMHRLRFRARELRLVSLILDE